MGCSSYWFLPKRFLHKSFLLGETLLSLVQNIVIISLISCVMGVTGLHLVVSFRRLLPSPPEIKRLIVLYTVFLLTPITLDNTLMLRSSTSLLSNIIRLDLFKTRSSSDLLMLTKLLWRLFTSTDVRLELRPSNQLILLSIKNYLLLFSGSVLGQIIEIG